MNFPPNQRRLPIGIQAFREIRAGNFRYVDKTRFALRLITEGKHYFLSRPRRFGKSLFVDTLKRLFEGRQSLFRGLAIEPRWDWSVRWPVVRLEFSKGNFKRPGYLHASVMAQLDRIGREAGVEPRYETAPERLDDLIRTLHRRCGRRAVILVDEYDKPILDALEQPEIASENRDDLRGLYSVIKSCDDHLRFSFLTGVSKFSKVSLFSGLNNLRDITLTPRYSSICGYTERDLDTVFADSLEGLDRERVRDWYNGYSWGGEERVYNPFDVLLLLEEREYRNWWFETGTPRFLTEVLAKREAGWHRLDGMLASDEVLSRFDVGEISAEALLFQSGYLTITGKESRRGRPRYRLGYPNREVRESLNRALLDRVLGSAGAGDAQSDRLHEILQAGDLAGLEEHLRALLAGVPYQWHARNPMRRYEGWYASMLYSGLVGAGMDVRAEESSSRGRADLCVRGAGRVYVFELKMREGAGSEGALEQIKARGYADRYRGRGEPIHLVGVEFSAETRNVTRFETETV